MNSCFVFVFFFFKGRSIVSSGRLLGNRNVSVRLVVFQPSSRGGEFVANR